MLIMTFIRAQNKPFFGPHHLVIYHFVQPDNILTQDPVCLVQQEKCKPQFIFENGRHFIKCEHWKSPCEIDLICEICNGILSNNAISVCEHCKKCMMHRYCARECYDKNFPELGIISAITM